MGWAPQSLIVLGIVYAISASNSGFILTVPNNVIVGQIELICITLHNTIGPARISLDVFSNYNNTKIASIEQVLHEDFGCMELFITNTTSAPDAYLHLKATFDQMLNYSFNSIKPINIIQYTDLVLINTDKPMYKPGDLVQFRILNIDREFKAKPESQMSVWVQRPSGVRVTQWPLVKLSQGMVHLDFQLSEEPALGNWTIVAEENGPGNKQYGVQFEVSEYVLPRFQVSISPPDYITADSKLLTWIICAKYSYGQPVKGRVNIKIDPLFPSYVRICEKEQTQIHGYYGGNDCVEQPLNINLVKPIDGCLSVNVSGEELGLDSLKGTNYVISEIKLTANVNEANTDIEHSETSVTKIVHHALILQFSEHSPTFYYPEISYVGKLKVLYPNNAPAPGKKIKICVQTMFKGCWEKKNAGCRRFLSDSKGVVHFIIPKKSDPLINKYSLTAAAVDYADKFYSSQHRWNRKMNMPTGFHEIHPWYSPSNSYMSISNDENETPRCNYHHIFRVQFTTTDDVKFPSFFYIVKARGSLILSGHVTPQHIGPKSLVNIISDNSNLTQHHVASKVVLKQFGLKLLILPKMSPGSQLMVYYVRDDGETVAAGLEVDVEHCFANKVSAVWQENKLLPGSLSVLHLAAAPNSLCSISGIDKSTTFTGKHKSITFDTLSKQLDLTQIYKYNHYNQWASEPIYCETNEEEDDSMDLRKKRSSPYNAYVELHNSLQAFHDSGILVISNLKMDLKPCIQRPKTAIHDYNTGGPRVFSPNVFSSHDFGASAGGTVPQYRYDSHMPVPFAAPGSGVDFPPESSVRSFFPESWIWTLTNIGEDGKAQLRSKVPDTITDWVGTTVCLSAQQGLGISELSELTVFRPIFLELALPYSVKRGEIVLIKTVLYNFLSQNLPIHLTFQPMPNVELLSNASVTFEISDHANKVHHFRIRATALGSINLTVIAEVDKDFQPKQMRYRRDTLKKPLLVKPEGFPVEILKSTFVCPANTSAEDRSTFWNLELPSDVVKGSARAKVRISADLMGPTMQNLNKLVRMPMGCGEQNMVLLVPNIQVINYLTSINEDNQELLTEAKQNIKKGYQGQLNYLHYDGSYSAFGKADRVGSMWLTAFVVKTFSQAQHHISLDKDSLKQSMFWIVSQQMENGCFPAVGKVYQQSMKGGLSNVGTTTGLTAYVLIALLESNQTLPHTVLASAKLCLEADKKIDMYTLSLKTYALSLFDDRAVAQESLNRLLAYSTMEEDYLYWEIGQPVVNEGTSKAINVEIAAYALLALIKLGGDENFNSAHQAVKWISQQRNAQGGFVSTQDTAVALEALAKYATIFSERKTNLNILVVSSNLEHNFHIRPQNRLVLQEKKIPILPTQLEVVSEGKGCVLVQSCLRYNIHSARDRDDLEMTLKVSPVPNSIDACSLQKLDVCVRYKPQDLVSNMAVLELEMASGFIPEKASLKKLDHTDNVKRWEVRNDQVNLYFDNLSNHLMCLSITLQLNTVVENPLPANAHLYDYYQPEVSIIKEYQVAINCGGDPAESARLIQFEGSANDDSLGNSEPENVMVRGNNQLSEQSGDVSAPIALSKRIPAARSSRINPGFIDVDHELSFPEGVEGPTPAITTLEGRVVSCPRCWDRFPKNFVDIYCNASTVYKAVVRKEGVIRLLLDLTPSSTPTRLRRLVKFNLPEGCNCSHLRVQDESADANTLLVIGQPIEDPNNIKLDSSANIWSVSAVHGQPEVVKGARSKCPL